MTLIPALALGLAAVAMAVLFPGEFDLLLDHWAFFVPSLVILAAVRGAGRHYGVPSLFRDDAQIFGPEPCPAERAWSWRPLASPAFWSGFGFAGLFGYAWIIAHASALRYCASGPDQVVCPTELYLRDPAMARWGFIFMLAALAFAAAAFFLATIVELNRRPGRNLVPMREELARTAIGLILGALVATTTYVVSDPMLPLDSLPVPGFVESMRSIVQWGPSYFRPLEPPDHVFFGMVVAAFLVAAVILTVLWRNTYEWRGPALWAAAVVYAALLLVGLLIVALHVPEANQPRVAGVWVVAWFYLTFVVATFVIRNSLPCVSIIALSVSLLTIGLVWPLVVNAAAVFIGEWQLGVPGVRGNRLIATFFLGVGGVVVFALVNGGRFRYRLPGFGDAYDNPADPKNATERGGADLVDPVTALKAWRRKAVEKPILVALAVSGGAYRATFWTSVVLDRLIAMGAEGKLPHFVENVRLVTGASGGMVAGAYFAALREGGDTSFGVTAAIENDTRDYMHRVESRAFPIKRDSLSAVVHQLVQWDIRDAFLPGRPTGDRGRALEAQWTTLTGAKAAPHSFGWLSSSVANGEAPALIISPMLVESGALAIFSNLDLQGVRDRGAAAGSSDGDASATSVEIFKEFPHAYKAMTLATAVRVNASFPYISPAISLPTVPSRRAVDAGYYDNFGVDLLTDYLEEDDVFHWIKENCRGVAVIQIRAFPSQVETPEMSRATFAFQFLTSPIEGIASARRASQLFRNDQQLALAQQRYGDGFLKVFTFELDREEVSMSWYLRDEELNALRQRLDDPGPMATLLELQGFFGQAS
jgi:ABC-type Fe3+-siderophore transport system permease subunit